MTHEETITVIIRLTNNLLKRFVLVLTWATKTLQSQDALDTGKHLHVRGEVDLARLLTNQVHCVMSLLAANILFFDCVDSARLNARQCVCNRAVLFDGEVGVTRPYEGNLMFPILVRLERKLIDVVAVFARHEQASFTRDLFRSWLDNINIFVRCCVAVQCLFDFLYLIDEATRWRGYSHWLLTDSPSNRIDYLWIWVLRCCRLHWWSNLFLFNNNYKLSLVSNEHKGCPNPYFKFTLNLGSSISSLTMYNCCLNGI